MILLYHFLRVVVAALLVIFLFIMDSLFLLGAVAAEVVVDKHLHQVVLATIPTMVERVLIMVILLAVAAVVGADLVEMVNLQLLEVEDQLIMVV